MNQVRNRALPNYVDNRAKSKDLEVV